MKKNNKKIALVLGNCTAHPVFHSLTNVKLMSLPPNKTANTQPIGPRVIRCLKAPYRKNLVEMRLLAFEGRKNLEPMCLEAMKLFDQAWIFISEKYILLQHQNKTKKLPLSPKLTQKEFGAGYKIRA